VLVFVFIREDNINVSFVRLRWCYHLGLWR